MADNSPEDWLPAGWTVSVRVRRNGKKDKQYFAPCGQKFYSKVEVMRYLKTVQCSPPHLKKQKDTIFEEFVKDASAEAVQKECPNFQEKGKSGTVPSSQNGSPESDEKYYSAAETAEGDGGNTPQSGSLSSEDKGNTDPEGPAEDCSHPKFGEKEHLATKDHAQNVCCSSMEAAKPNLEQSTTEKYGQNVRDSSVETAKPNLEQSTENCSASRPLEVKNDDFEEPEHQICGNSAENVSHQSKEEENTILEEVGKDDSDHSKEKKKARPKQSAYVVVERGVAEGLPDGWIKEIKARKKNNVVRKDPYYIDPVSGYVFRSMKDSLRYVATGKIGRLAFKRKDIDDSDTELEDEKSSSPAATEVPKLDKNGTGSKDQRSKQTRHHNSAENQATTRVLRSTRSGASITDLTGSDLPKPKRSQKNKGRNSTNGFDSPPPIKAEVPRDEHPLGKMEEMPVSADKDAEPRDELTPENKEDKPAPAEVAEFLRDEQPQEKTEKTRSSADEDGASRAKQLLEKTEMTCAPADEAGVPQDEQSSQRTEEIPGGKKTPESSSNSRKKKVVLDLPRRSSSRLAGVAVDPGLEVKRTRAQRGAVRKLDEGEASGEKSVSARDRSPLQPQTKRTRRGKEPSEPVASVGPSEAALGEDSNKTEGDRTDNEKKKGKNPIVMPQENVFTSNHAEQLKTGDEPEEKTILPFELPSGDILSDPCIEFAIKTLTGIDFDTSKSNTKSSDESNSSRDAGSGKVRAEHMEIEREFDKKQLPLEKNTSKGCSYEEKAGAEVPSSSISNLPLGDSWQDPCIEFAIKTLTGAIPVEYDLDIHDLMRQQIRSSQIQESTEVALSNVGLDNFCRTDLLWQHSSDVSADKTAYRQQNGVVPITPQPGNNNIDLQKRAGGAVRRQHHQTRGNKYQR